MQRLRVTFARGEATKYITHLDTMRFWERALRRARLPVAQTQGFHPHPRIALAAPMPVGITGEAELMDVFLDEPVTPSRFLERLAAQMVAGIEVLDVETVDVETPSLQALMRCAEYRVTVESDRTLEDVRASIEALLKAESFPWEHLRDGSLRQYDLRPQVAHLAVAAADEGRYVLAMRLQTDSKAAGRPEQVARALGFSERPLAIHRVRLELAEGTPLRR